jgi:Ca-activated chloride channel family protein
MNKLVLGFSVLLGISVSAFGQTDRTSRPRVVPTSTPPVIQNDPYPAPTQSAPPVLIGGSSRPAPTATATPGSGGEDEIIKVETNLVTMPVSVLDRDGRFISGLSQKDFKIYEDGKEQKIDYFQSVEQPFTVVLLIDVSPSTQFRIEEIQNAAISFVNQLRPNDRVMVMSFDQRVQVLTPPTSDRYMLRSAIQFLRFGSGTSLYEAVDQTIYRELSRIEGRKAVVLFTDGVDTTSRRASYDSTIRATEEVDAMFYTIRYDTSRDMGRGGWGNGNPPPPRRTGRITMADVLAGILSGGNVTMTGQGSSGDYQKGKEYLEAIATNSGGRPFEASSMYNLDAAFSGIAEELRRQYSLGYYPEVVGSVGDRKQIRVRVMRPEVVVRAKTSYIVGQSDRKLAGK